MRRSLWSCFLSGLALFAPLSAPAAKEQVDLELVLAVDASGSIDWGEYALQMGGIAEAFRDPEVHAAVQSGPLGRIAVTLVLWAEANRPKQALPWHAVSGPASAEIFAEAVKTMPRNLPSGGTGIGKALQFATWQIQRNGYEGSRKVIDVSGDGRETAFREHSLNVDGGRLVALNAGITVNGLAILNDVPTLRAYYRDRVIGGFDAFVMTASDFKDFARAIRRKLIREIEYNPKVSAR